MTKTHSFKRAAWLLLLLVPLLIVAGCGNQSASKSKTVRLGIMGSDTRIWKPIQKKLAKEGITLKIVTFTDYNQPNAALSNHEIDINSFQHRYFLNTWNKAHHTDLVPIGNTYIGSARLYSKKIKSVKDIKKGETIAVANDATNEGRALHLLQSAGLIKLNPKKTLPTTQDITQNKLNLKIVPMDAAQTPRALSDAVAAVVSNEFAVDAKLTPKQVIYTEKINKDSKPYINIIVANKADRNNPTYKKVVKAYQTNATKKLLDKVYDHTLEPAWNLTLK